MARAFTGKAITAAMSAAIDEHVAFLDTSIYEKVFVARLTVLARKPRCAHAHKMAKRCVIGVILKSKFCLVNACTRRLSGPQDLAAIIQRYWGDG